MVAALRDVELLGGCFKLRDSQGHATPIARFLRRLPPHLQSLKILDLADTDKAALEMWLSACLQPLKQLTRLRISCSGNAYLDLSDSAWLELQGLTALQDFVLEPRYEGGLLLGGCHAWLARCAQLTRLHLVCTMEPDRDLLVSIWGGLGCCCTQALRFLAGVSEQQAPSSPSQPQTFYTKRAHPGSSFRSSYTSVRLCCIEAKSQTCVCVCVSMHASTVFLLLLLPLLLLLCSPWLAGCETCKTSPCLLQTSLVIS